MSKFKIALLFVLAGVVVTLFSFTNKAHESAPQLADCIMVKGDMRYKFDNNGNLDSYKYASGAQHTQNDLYPLIYWVGEGYELQAVDNGTYYFCK